MRDYTVRRQCSNTFKLLGKNNCDLRMLCPPNLLSKKKSEIKTFSDICRQKLSLMETFAERNTKGYISRRGEKNSNWVKEVSKACSN